MFRRRKAAPETARPEYPFEVYRTVQTDWHGPNFDLQRKVNFCGGVAVRALEEGLRQLSQPEEISIRDKQLSGYGPYTFPPGVFSYPIFKHHILYGDEVAAMLASCDNQQSAAKEIGRRIGRRGLRPLELPQSAISGVVIEPGETVNRLCLGLDTEKGIPAVDELVEEYQSARADIYNVTGFDLLPRRPSIAFGEMPRQLQHNENTIELAFPELENTAEDERQERFEMASRTLMERLEELKERGARCEVTPATALRLFIEDQINQSIPPEGWQPVGLRPSESRYLF